MSCMHRAVGEKMNEPGVMSQLCTGSFLVPGRTDGGRKVVETDTMDSVDMCYLIFSWRR
jgi:hypothetical protein